LKRALVVALVLTIGGAMSHAVAEQRSFSGLASYYSYGGGAASGARADPNGFTAAHRTLPFGTRVRVTDPKSNRTIIVTINDRGPFIRNRVIDVSFGAARALGMMGRGVVYVRADIL
jgi:rare lipoprotein A